MFASFRCHPVLMALLLTAGITPSFADVSRRTILATGDGVPGFGSIGSDGLSIKAIANDGRLLVHASISDGRQGLFWAEHRQLTPIWLSDQAPGVTIEFFAAAAQTTGAVVVPARASRSAPPFFYVLPPTGEPRVIHPPSTDESGSTLCYVDAYRTKVNRNGDIAFRAEIASPGRDCFLSGDSDQRPSAVYVSRGTQVTRALSTIDLSTSIPSNDWIEPIGITDDGTVIAAHHWFRSGVPEQTIVAARAGSIHRIVGSGDPGPSGAPLSSPLAVIANALGDVAFTAVEGDEAGLYRTQGGRVIRVAWPFASPSGTPYAIFPELGPFNSAGDIAIAGAWYGRRPDGSLDEGQGVVLYPAGGDARIVFLTGRDTGLGRYAAVPSSLALNDNGALAFSVRAYDGNAAVQALILSEGVLETAWASGDPGPDGIVVAAQGLNWYSNLHCLAADGRVAAVASSTTGHEGLVCVDADGPHLVVQSGIIAPDGYAFTDFADCRFTDDGALIFSGSRNVPMDSSQTLVGQASVYRASPNGIERLYGDGDIVSNGTKIPDYGSNVSFVANAKGSVLALPGGTSDGLFLRHDGRLDVVRYGDALQWALADNDDVVIITRLGDWRPPDWPGSERPAGNAVLVWSGGRVQVIASVESAPPAVFRGFTNLAVRGGLVLFTKLGGQDQPDRTFFYRLGDAEPDEIPAAVASGGILDFTPAGRILRHVTGAYEVLSPNGTNGTLVLDTPEVTPFGINDRGNVALYSYANPPDSPRQTIELVGPGPDGSARCPLPLTPPVGTPPNTSTPTPTPPPVVGIGPYRAYVSDAAGDRVMVIDTATQELLASIIVSHRPTELAASPDGRRIFVLAGSRVDVIDAATLQVARTVSLGEAGARIIAGPDNATTFVSLWSRVTGQPRVIVVDGDSGLVTSILGPRGWVFGFNTDGTHLLATSTRGAPCDSTSQLVESNLLTAEVTRSTAVGHSATAGAVSADGTRAYVIDGCTSQLFVIDLATFAVVETLAIDQGGADVVVTADGRRAYTTHSSSSYYTNPDGSHTTPQGYVSAVDLVAGTFERIPVAGGGTEHAAVTPDGRLLYVTLGAVAVIDTQTNTQVTKLLPAGGASDVVVAPVPDPPLATPTPRRPRVIMRAEDVAGLVNDDVPIVVSMESGGLNVHAVEHDLITTANVPLLASYPKLPACQLNPQVEAVASFEFTPFCTLSCDRVHVRIRASEPGGSLPRNGILYTCTANLSYAQFDLRPILMSRATAADAAGQPLPVWGADGEVRVLSRDDATPRPTRTRPPTATRTVTATATATPLPVVIEIGAATLAQGSRVPLPVVLHTNGASVVGVQNDLGFTRSTPIVAASTGKPQCAVNAAIGKPNTSFVFMPVGCDHAQGECTAVRAIVLSLDNVNPIADQSVLYTCLVEAPPRESVGTFALHVSALYVSDPSGGLLPAAAVDGSVSVSAAPAPQSSSTATATATHVPVPASSPVPTGTFNAPRSSDDAALERAESRMAPGGGCNMSPHSNGWSAILAVCVLLAVLLRPRARARVAPMRPDHPG